MSSMPYPTLIHSAVSLVNRALSRSRDGIVRIELDRHLDLAAFISESDDGVRRFGLTTPFASAGVRSTSRRTKDARTITKWRNEPVARRRAAPLIIVGNATGRSEAGLRRAPVVLTEADVLREYRGLGQAWLTSHVAVAGPARLFASLVDMALDGRIDASALDEYSTEVFGDPASAHVRPQRELWRLGLLPDDRAMDSRTPGTRLSLNHRTVDFLVSSPDSAAEERQFERIVHAEQQGNAIAQAARKYSASRNVSMLANVQLDSLLELLQRRNGDEPPITLPDPLESISFFDALDLGSVAILDGIREELKDWDPHSADECHASVEVADCRVRIALDSLDSEAHIASDGERPSLWSVRPPGSHSDAAQRFPPEALREAAAEADALLQVDTAVALAERYLRARDAVLPLERWSDFLLETLLIKPELLEAAEEYIASWRDLVGFALANAASAHTAVLRQYLALLDGDWESAAPQVVGDDFQSVELRPLHPFVLLPHLEIARYVETNKALPEVATQALWIRDRTVPAYPALWSERTTLVHRRGAARPVFAKRGERQRPETSSKAGILDVVESYLGLHPFARDNLSLLFVDPPGGSGIPSAIRSLASGGKVGRLKVYVVHTDSDSPDWPGLSGVVTDLGRVSNLAQWSADCFITANLAFVFQSARAALASSHTGDFRPTRGLQNVLTVSVAPPPVTAPTAQRSRRIPFVSVQPRDANEVVNLLMQLARATEREDRFYQVEPMLLPEEASHIAAVAKLCDWLSIATPSPIGMIPPRRFDDESLVYLGREDSGAYGFFVYGRDLFAVRRHIQRHMADAPLQPHQSLLEAQIERLALSVPNGVLRIGRGQGDVTAQIGLMAASALSSDF